MVVIFPLTLFNPSSCSIGKIKDHYNVMVSSSGSVLFSNLQNHDLRVFENNFDTLLNLGGHRHFGMVSDLVSFSVTIPSP